MSNKQKLIYESFSFQVSQSELGALIIDLLKLKPDTRSPIKAICDNYIPNSIKVSKNLEMVASDESVQNTLQILAKPELIMENRNGGGSQVLNYFTACQASSINEDAFAVIMPSFEGTFMFQLFETPWLYLAWWIDLYASKPLEPVPNFMPPPLQLESLVYLLHSIDCYRRCSFISQLSFTPTDSPSITLDAYVETFKQSIKSADLRWLLPSFFALVPNLDLSEFNEDAEYLKSITELDFLLPEKNNNTNDAVFGFGEAGQFMGVEFYRCWFQSIGFEISVLTNNKWQILQRGFLAPTSLANHLILTEANKNNALTFNHQAMTREALEFKLSQIFRSILSGTLDQMAELPSIENQVESSSNFIICASCGAKLPADAKFCNHCGAPVPKEEESSSIPKKPEQKVRKCPVCGAELPPGAKFCTSCGAPVPAQEKVAPAVEKPIPQVPKCPKCGAELKPGAKFCTSCGEKV